jgi:hypothetical protein
MGGGRPGTRTVPRRADPRGEGITRRTPGGAMPPNGVKPGTKRARQYEKIKESVQDQGKSESTAEEIAARTVNKERAQHGESKEASKTSTDDKSPSQRGGERSGTNRPKGRTKDQLYNEAKDLNVEGRSSMNKDELQKAVDAKK